jgi:NTE family protein
MENGPQHSSELAHPARPRIGLALSGGAARGIAHVGVLRALEENHVRVDAIAGASAGALIGGCYAAGLSIDELTTMARHFRWRRMARLSFSRLGFQTNAKMEKFLREHLPVTRFEDLKIRFAALTMDLQQGTAVVFRDEGDLPFAIRASTCIPAVYTPVRDSQGRWLVDGGLVASLPISYVRDLGADIVIASDVNFDGARFFEDPKTAMGVLAHTFVAVERIVANQDRADADVLITPKVGHIRWDQTRRADELLQAGYEAAMESMDKIKSLVTPEPVLRPEPSPV